MKFDPQHWLAVDPDTDTRTELRTLISTDPDEVTRRFAGRLHFGTAGIRGPLGAGPMAMNRVLVRMVASATGTVLRRQHRDADARPEPAVVIGYDARHGSVDFAHDSARVLAAQGLSVTIIAGPNPTPLLAFAVRQLGAAAGIMVTASHNPAADNGVKVYWGDGAQIVAPIDQMISDAIDSGGLVDDDALAPLDHPLIRDAQADLVDRYVAARLIDLDPAGPRGLRIAYTPLHGVGGELAHRLCREAGFGPLVTAPEQDRPDPEFPTAPFPNPEEPGALDRILAAAATNRADIVFANDPDADRLAVAVPVGDTWRQLSGNEIGALLGDHLLRSTTGPNRLVVTTVVSSRLLRSIAQEHDAVFIETLTGFKWIMRVATDHPDLRFVFGFEEALGYAVDQRVRDKDGLSAMLRFAELAAQLQASGQTVLDRLYAIFARHGVYRSAQRSIRSEDALVIEAHMASLRSEPPTHIGAYAVESMADLLAADSGFAPTNALVFELERQARVIARPSGTEPKLKLYGEVVLPVPPDATMSIAAVEGHGDVAVAELLDAFAGHLSR